MKTENLCNKSETTFRGIKWDVCGGSPPQTSSSLQSFKDRKQNLLWPTVTSNIWDLLLKTIVCLFLPFWAKKKSFFFFLPASGRTDTQWGQTRGTSGISWTRTAFRTTVEPSTALRRVVFTIRSNPGLVSCAVRICSQCVRRKLFLLGSCSSEDELRWDYNPATKNTKIELIWWRMCGTQARPLLANIPTLKHE